MNPLQPLLRILIITVIFFLIFILVWLFYCRCYRRGSIEPNGPYGTVSQPLNYATAKPNRVEGGKYPAFTPTGAYPSLATNENGEVGISLAWGGKKNAGGPQLTQRTLL